MNDDESQPIECRAAVDLTPGATNELLFLPIGLHAITPVAGGIGRAIKVKVDARTADAIEQQRALMAGKGKRPYFDFNHEDGPASFWPEAFIWRQGEGVIAKGEWSRRGRAAVEGKDYRAFSPVFHVDNKRGDPATVVCKDLAEPNMGGLVNNPAFKDLPLWAKNAGVTALQQQTEETEMNAEDIAALRAKQQELENTVSALVAQNADQQELSTAEAELKATQLKIETEELRARNESLEAKVRKRAHEDAKAAVRAAVQKGSILAKDIKTQKEWETELTANPDKKAMLEAIPGNNRQLATRIVGGDNITRVTITDEEPSRIYGELGRVMSLARRSTNPAERRQFAKEFAAIYARELRAGAPNADRMLSFPLTEIDDALIAADVTDSNLGTLSGTLVTQRTLELLKFTFPALTMFTTDFSSESAQFNQTIISRTIEIPNVVTYNATTGWPDSDADTNDVPVTIDHHEGVQITFNENILASTVRRLFDEFAPASAYALAKALVDDLYSNITDANFPNNTVVATASFTRTSVITLGTELTLRGVPLALGQRTLLLYPTVFAKLVGDTALITFAAYQKPELVTNPQTGASLVIPVDTFSVVNSPNLPTNNGNVTGFGCSKSALILATRVPNDYTTAMPGSSNGNVQVVTDPDIGISVMLTQYVDHQLGRATSRFALMYGTAAGQSDAGQLLKAAAGSGSGRGAEQGQLGAGGTSMLENQNLDDMTIPELKAVAEQRGIAIPSDANKAEIVKAVKNSKA